MKKKKLALFLIVAIAFSCISPWSFTTYAEGLDECLVAHYEFDDNYDDISGNNNHGTSI